MKLFNYVKILENISKVSNKVIIDGSTIIVDSGNTYYEVKLSEELAKGIKDMYYLSNLDEILNAYYDEQECVRDELQLTCTCNKIIMHHKQRIIKEWKLKHFAQPKRIKLFNKLSSVHIKDVNEFKHAIRDKDLVRIEQHNGICIKSHNDGSDDGVYLKGKSYNDVPMSIYTSLVKHLLNSNVNTLVLSVFRDKMIYYMEVIIKDECIHRIIHK